MSRVYMCGEGGGSTGPVEVVKQTSKPTGLDSKKDAEKK